MGRVYAGSYVPEQSQGSKRIAEQLIGYELQVFSYTNLFWHQKRNHYLVPGGKLQKIFSADIGELVASFVLSFSHPEGFNYADGKVRFPGKKSREKDFLLPAELREFEEHAYLIFVARKQEFVYNFKLRKDIISVENPLEFRVTQYRSIDGKIKERESERVVPQFEKVRGSNIPKPNRFSLIVSPEVTDPRLN